MMWRVVGWLLLSVAVPVFAQGDLLGDPKLDAIEAKAQPEVRKTFQSAAHLVADHDQEFREILTDPSTLIIVVPDVIKTVAQLHRIEPAPGMESEMSERFYIKVLRLPEGKLQHRIYLGEKLFTSKGRVAASLSHGLGHVYVEKRRLIEAAEAIVYRRSVINLRGAIDQDRIDRADRADLALATVEELKREKETYRLARLATLMKHAETLGAAQRAGTWVVIALTNLKELEQTGKQITHFAVIKIEKLQLVGSTIEVTLADYDLARGEAESKRATELLEKLDRPDALAKLRMNALSETVLKAKKLKLASDFADRENWQISHVARTGRE
jgi:hypothetical protein